MIEVDSVSKLYRIGGIGSGTISQDISQWWRRMKGKSNIYGDLGELNDHSTKSESGYVWSLKDISFEVNQGDVFGVIGKNGAGKSTLLKLISKITKPTSGNIKLKGRVASLLEVGTGFHPDLSGRENIYLNGAILGMTKNEIKKKFDEIVSFSGIERYIDTPVKRYSSGMYVRLGFAVAAHLEPEILIVDEVLAVGDSEFQKKCLGKMHDVSAEGRTVLFVSHNIPAVKQLCNRGVLLDKGEQSVVGDIDEVLSFYQTVERDAEAGKRNIIPSGTSGYFTGWRLLGDHLPNEHSSYSRDTCHFSFSFTALEEIGSCEVRFLVRYDTLAILHATSKGLTAPFSLATGKYQFRFSVEFPIRDAQFEIEVLLLSYGSVVDSWTSTTKLTILDNFESHVDAGMLVPELKFSIKEDSMKEEIV